MNAKIEAILRELTEEENNCLNGQQDVQYGFYTDENNHLVFRREKLLPENRLITVRKHTRFVDFPEHSHDYVEFFYVFSGEMTHIIKGRTITMHQGDLLFMNQHVSHQIKACQEDDLAVNLIIHPAFFEYMNREMMEGTFLYEFLKSILQKEGKGEYLYFPAWDDVCVPNIMENIVYTLYFNPQMKARAFQASLFLLFMYIMEQSDKVQVSLGRRQDSLFMSAVRHYIEEHYADGSLTDLAEQMGYSVSALSRLIKKQSGSNFKDLQLDARMSQAARLLSLTQIPIDEVSERVGYENRSFFYRRFFERYGMTPNDYRIRSGQNAG